jgi:hypothetical protein
MRTALLLIGFNRVDYFDETLTSLEANPEAHDCDLHVYLDGGPKANQEALRKRIDSSSFENITVVARDENWGIGRHLIDARRRLFDQQNYDRVLLFEDDMVLAPSYVATLLNMMDWSMDYNDIGTVMAYNINHDAAEIQASQTNEVIATNRHFWGYGMAKSVWDDIKSVVYEFEQRYLTDVAYADRSHRSIRWRFIRSVAKKGRIERPGNSLVPESILTAPFSTFPYKCPTSQDAITALALWRHGYARLTTRVSRAKYVGQEGFSFSPEMFEKMGFGEQNTLELSELNTAPEAFTLALEGANGTPLKPKRYE